MKITTYKLFFKALSNRTRFKIVQLLREGPLDVKSISEQLDFEQSRVSHNLKCLKNCGFVVTQRSGKNKVYSLDKEHIIPILNEIDRHIEKYEERLRRCGVLKGEKSNERKI